MDEQQYSGTDKSVPLTHHQGFDPEYALEHSANQQGRHIERA